MAQDAFGIVGSVIASAYHVESVVAEGGFGTVYRAHHGGFRAPVALKCLRLPPGLLHEARQHFLDSFRAEAELLFRLSASIANVVRPLHVDAFTLPDGRFVPYIVLEWLEGGTLDALIRKRRSDGQPPLALKKAVRLLTPVARALERAHNFRGPDGPVSILHRDLKPENIFVAHVAGEEVVKILDFGIAKAKSMLSQVAGRASQGSADGMVTFTPAYGSPEQWAPKRYGQTGPWTDVWGLALTLTEVLVGHPLFEGDPATIMEGVLDAHRRPTPGSEGVIVSDEVERVFYKALSLDPRQRYGDAGVFWDELLAAARITSGEVQEVRLQRDARAEAGGGMRVEHVEVGNRPSGQPPRPSALPPRSLPRGQPPPPLTSAAAPQLAPLPARDPGSVSPLPVAFPSSVSGSFEVPDLDLTPVSRPTADRSPSGTRPVVTPPLELDELIGDWRGGAPLDLDLPSGEPIARRVSSAGRPGSQDSDAPLPASTPVPPARVSSSPPSQRSGRPSPVSIDALRSSAPAPDSSPRSRSRGATSGAPEPSSRRLSDHQPGWRWAAEPDASLVQRLLPGALVLVGAVLVTVLDQLYAAVSGEIFTILGLRTSAVAGVFVVVGVALCLYRLKRD